MELFDELENQRNFKSGGPASDAAIALAEKELGVTFPEDYKLFLQRFSYALWSEGKIAGIHESTNFGVVEGTLLCAENSAVAFPKCAIYLDNSYVMFCDPSPKATLVSKRYSYMPDPGPSEFNNFTEYLRFNIRQRM